MKKSQITFHSASMACIAPVLFSGFSQLPTTTFAVASLTASVIRDFFLNVFLHPGDNYIGVAIVAGLIALPVVGLAFLIKLIYDKYCPDVP